MSGLLALLLWGQLLYWDQGIETAPTLARDGIRKIAVPAERAAAWTQAGFVAVPVSADDLKARRELDPPGVDREITVAAATRRPWIDANGWQFRREGSARYFYDVPAGSAARALAEAHVFGADALLKVAPGDLSSVAGLLRVLATVPATTLPDVAQIEIVDDGSTLVGEVMNLLSRRNLLWRPAGGPGPARAALVRVRIGSARYPKKAAQDPSAFAHRLRRQIGDGRRVLRLYGSEEVLCRLQAEGARARLQLINYGGGVKEGIRVRIQGLYRRGSAVTDRAAVAAPLDHVTAGDATEFTVPAFAAFALVDLEN